MTIDVLVHADSSPRYYGYYLDGLSELFGGINLHFGKQDLPAIRSAPDGLPVVLPDGLRLFIAAGDRAELNPEALKWSHAYGAVNLAPGPIPHGVVALGPGFGVRSGNRGTGLINAVRAWRVSGSQVAGPPACRRAINRHWRTRRSLTTYVPGTADPAYLFAQATFWSRHREANMQRRLAFDTLRRAPDVNFDGGFVPDGEHDLAPTLVAQPLDLDEYIRRTQRSVAAINTPAVHGCLGWKLGEFLALGKAIISTPLDRAMPGPADFNYLIEVDGTPEGWLSAVERLAHDHALRARTESRARAYFDDWVAPRAAMERLVEVARTKQRG